MFRAVDPLSYNSCVPSIWGRLSSRVSHLIYTEATGSGGFGATLVPADVPRKAAIALRGVMPTAELQFLLETHADSAHVLFGSAPAGPNAIFLFAMMAARASLRKHQPLLKDARALIFIDNDASRHALINGDSIATMARWIAQE